MAGAPTIKTVPTNAASPLSFTFTAIKTGLCAYAWTSNSSTISSSNYISGGVFIDNTLTPILIDVPANTPFQITSSNPITERLGDPPAGVNPI